MLIDMSSVLIEFRARYQARWPRIQSQGVQAVRLTPSGGFRLLPVAPAQDVAFGYPPKARYDSLHRYLWVINDDGIPFILEIPIDALNGEKPKHTNLTEGRPAYIGGELWFETDRRIFVSGGSGRYKPEGEGQACGCRRRFRIVSVCGDFLRVECGNRQCETYTGVASWTRL